MRANRVSSIHSPHVVSRHDVSPHVVRSARVPRPLVVLTLAAVAAGQQPTIERISVDALGRQADGPSTRASISADGRYVAFQSAATNLVPGDDNAAWDVFVRDRRDGGLRRVSVSSTGAQADGDSGDTSLDALSVGGGPVLSADGRFVAFESRATNLVAGDDNGVTDVFVRDLATGTTERVSVSNSLAQGDGASRWASISSDGRYVAFQSAATNLVDGDTNGSSDVFLRDRLAGATARVSVSSALEQADQDSFSPALSLDGRFVAFGSAATNLVSGDDNGVSDAFVRDRTTGVTERVSVDTSGQAFALESARHGLALSADGGRVVFDTRMPIATFPWTAPQILLRDRIAGTTQILTWMTTGAPGDHPSAGPSISADGGQVAFGSWAFYLVPADANFYFEVYLRDVDAASTSLVSFVTSGGPIGDDGAFRPCVSADARWVAFDGSTRMLVPDDTNGCHDVFVLVRGSDEPTIARYCAPGTSASGCAPTISALGTPSASAGSGFLLGVANAPGASTGMILFGVVGPDASPFPAGAGTLCLAQPFRRTRLRSTGGHAGACDGAFQLDWNTFVATTAPVGGSVFVGRETVWAQGWARDGGSRGGSVLSDAAWFVVRP